MSSQRDASLQAHRGEHQILARGTASSSPYETAAVAMTLRDRSLVDWLLQRQHDDGSWGGRIPFVADRLLQTLMVTRSLKVLCEHEPATGKVGAAIAGGVHYCADALALLDERALEACDLAGFELLVPAHLRALRDLGAVLPPLPAGLVERSQRKLRMLSSVLSSGIPPAHVLHAAEALEASPDGAKLTHDIARGLDPDSLVGSSPSATAYLLRAGDLEGSRVERLQHTLRAACNEDGGYAATVPMDAFITLWIMYFDILAGRAQGEAFARVFDALAERQDLSAGVGCNPSFVSDADDTAVALLVAATLGKTQAARLLARALLVHFYDSRGGFFRTYPFEMTTSVTTNAHAIEALRAAAPILDADTVASSDEAWRRAADYLTERSPARDKWHVSRYYSILSCACALREMKDAGREPGNWRAWRVGTLERILDEQQVLGGWGEHGEATCEETSYALITLAMLSGRTEKVTSAARRGIKYIREQPLDLQTELWIDKTLYQPSELTEKVRSTALAMFLES